MKIAIAGAGGRMGRALLDAATTTEGVTLGAALDLPGTAWAGRDAGDLCSNAEGITVGIDVNMVDGKVRPGGGCLGTVSAMAGGKVCQRRVYGG